MDTTKISTINNESESVVYSEVVASINDGEKQNETKDPFGLVYFIMILQGAGTLFPWNSFISAPDYFNTLYGPSALLYLATIYSISNLLGLILMIWFGSKLSLFFKVVPAYLAFLVILVAIPVLGFIGIHGNLGFVITLIFVFVTAAFTAILQGGIFGFAGMLSPLYIQAVMLGNGVAGIVTSVIRVITKVTIESQKPVTLKQLNLSAAVYFFVSAGFILLCIVSYFVMSRTPFVMSRMNKKSKKVEDGEESTENDSLVPSSSTSQSAAVPASEAPVEKKASALAIMKKIWHMCFLVTFVFFVSLAIFPGLCVTIESYYGPGSVMADWLPVLMIVTFNVFDFLGRLFPRFIVLFGERSVTIPVLLRVILLPLFMMCIYPKVVYHDAVSLVFMGILSFTNGYLSSIVMMTAPGLVEPHEREMAGTIMTVFLLLGITLGSNSAMLIGKIVGLN